jgi:hypothetical protein
MIKRYALALITVFLFAAFLSQPASAAKEDTAQISLKKTAVSKQSQHKYTIKKGDVISAIIRRLPGITEEDIPDNYRIIKELNPDIENLNKLYAGQIIVLPGKSNYPTKEKNEKADSAALDAPVAPAAIRDYKIKKGDNLISIIHRELKIRSNTQQALKTIKSINPNIANLNKIYVGQIVKLPGKTVFIKAPEEAKTTEQTKAEQSESLSSPKKIVMPPEARFAVIKEIVGQMNGSVSSSGNYYLPIPRTGSVTIDCSLIPVIEFDDKTTVFLDWENRTNDNLKKMIRENWSNFSLVNVDKKDDVIVILRKIIAATKSYTMSKRETPVTVGNRPPVQLLVDWIITKKLSRQNYSLIQGLRLIPQNDSLLPKAIKNYARQNGLIITEIDEETGIAGKPEEIYTLPPLEVLPKTPAKDFSCALVTNLGFIAKKDADIKIFDMAKDGFNLSVKADVLIKNNDEQYIIYSRNIPQQFINVLKEAGNKLVFVADADSPQITMEKILRSLGVPFASGYFTFSGIEKNQAPYTFGFSGTKIKNGKDKYVIDFDIDQGLRGLLGEFWSADIVRY